MKLGTVVLCAWAMTALPSLADEGASPEARAFLKEWASAMAEVRSLRVRFTQTKTLRLLRKPRVSEGLTVLKGERLHMMLRVGRPVNKAPVRSRRLPESKLVSGLPAG